MGGGGGVDACYYKASKLLKHDYSKQNGVVDHSLQYCIKGKEFGHYDDTYLITCKYLFLISNKAKNLTLCGILSFHTSLSKSLKSLL